MNQIEKRKVLNLLKSKYKEKEIFENYFGFFGKMTTAFVSNKYIEELNDTFITQNNDQKLFADRMLMKDLKVVDEFLINLEKYE